jgi:hypothetical protein
MPVYLARREIFETVLQGASMLKLAIKRDFPLLGGDRRQEVGGM